MMSLLLQSNKLEQGNSMSNVVDKAVGWARRQTDRQIVSMPKREPDREPDIFRA